MAGTAGVAGYKDGTGTSARFNQPHDIDPDSTGNLYIADNGNACIRKIDAGNVVTTANFSRGGGDRAPPFSIPATGFLKTL